MEVVWRFKKKSPVSQYFDVALWEKSSECKKSVGTDRDVKGCVILPKDQAIFASNTFLGFFGGNL